jgi:hypothetical protein
LIKLNLNKISNNSSYNKNKYLSYKVHPNIDTSNQQKIGDYLYIYVCLFDLFNSVFNYHRMMFYLILLILILFPIVHNSECPNRELIEESFLNAHIPGSAIIVVD